MGGRKGGEQYGTTIKQTIGRDSNLHAFINAYKLKGKFYLGIKTDEVVEAGEAYVELVYGSDHILKGAGPGEPKPYGVDVKFSKLTPNSKTFLNNYYDFFTALKNESIKLEDIKNILQSYTVGDFVEDYEGLKAAIIGFAKQDAAGQPDADPFDIPLDAAPAKQPPRVPVAPLSLSLDDEDDPLADVQPAKGPGGGELPFAKAKPAPVLEPDEDEEDELPRGKQAKAKEPVKPKKAPEPEDEGEEGDDDDDDGEGQYSPADASKTMVMPARKVNYLLKNLMTDEVFPLVDGINTIGRTSDCNIAIDDPSVSKRHAKITKIQNDLFITDLGSSNGTIVNDKVVREGEKVKLESGDKVVVSDFEFLLEKKLPQKVKRQKALKEKVPLRKRHMLKIGFIAAVALLVLVLGYVGYMFYASMQRPEVEIEVVAQSAVTRGASFTGAVFGPRSFKISCPAECVVGKFSAQVGDLIAKDQEILSLDKQDIQEKINVLYKEINSLKEGKVQLEKEAMAAKVKDLKSRIEKLGELRATPVLVAPFSGTLIVKNAEEGAKVPEDQVIAEVSDKSASEVVATVSDDVFRMIDKGDRFFFKPKGGNVEQEGTLLAANDQGEGGEHKLVFVVQNSGAPLAPKSELAIRVEPDKALKIQLPRKAVVEGRKESIIYVYSNGKVALRKIEIERWFDDAVVVRSGVEAKEEIVVTNLNRLKNGAEVTLKTN